MADQDKKITDLTLISQISDSASFPIDNGIQTFRATGAQLKTYLAPKYIAPSLQKFNTSSGTYYIGRAFVVSGASVTIGATYTHNSVTWTAIATIAAGNIVYFQGNGTPLASGTLTKSGGTGDSSINFSEYRDPIAIEVEMVGGGAGGGGGGGTNGTGAGAGGSTTFGSSLLTCTGGASGANITPTAGGTATINAPAYGSAFGGQRGHYGSPSNAGATISFPFGGQGGSTAFGGGGGGGAQATIGNAGIADTGGGGGGGGASSAAGYFGGGGGGAGGYLRAIVPLPSASYAYAVGAGGTAGGNGTGGNGGAAGANGSIAVREFYQ